MKRLLTVPALLSTILLAVTTGDSPAATAGLGLGVHGGYGRSGDADSGSPLAGAHLVLNISSWLGVVGMADHKFEEDFSDGNDALTVTSTPISAMGRVYLPLGGMSPYVSAGFQYRLLSYGGDLLDDENHEIDDSDSSFGWLAGGGIVFETSPSSGIFGEVRYESFDPDKDFDNAIQDAEDLDFDQWSVRGGFTFFFR